MKKYSFPSSLFILGAFGMLVFLLGAAGVKYVLDFRIMDARFGAVAYANGTAEFVVVDDVPDQVGHTYRVTVPAVGAAPWWLAPDLVARGGNWERLVYTFNDQEADGCQNDIFFIDRIAKTGKALHINSCVQDTLDEHDVTRFIGTRMQQDMSMVVDVGSYEDGSILASHVGPANLGLNDWAFNWELDKAVLNFNVDITCSPDNDCTRTPDLYMWDLSANTWKSFVLPSFAYRADFTQAKLSYDHEMDRFLFTVPAEDGSVPRGGIVVVED